MMTLTQTQIAERKKHLGSSDIAAILGLDPFRNAGDVFLEKTGKVEEQPETAVMRRGGYIEPAILNYAEDELGPLNRNVYVVGPGCLASNVDGEVIETGNPVEAKSVGAFVTEVWGDVGTDEFPDRVNIQSHVHMICTGKQFCHVPVYLPYKEFQMYGVQRDTEVADTICEKAEDFWKNNVQKDIPPVDIVPSVSVMERIRRVPKKTVPLDPELWEAYKINQKMASAFEKAKEAARTAIMFALGEAEAGRVDEAGNMVTYYEQKNKGYIVEPMNYRVLRFKKAKK